MIYLWIKALHVISVIAWMAGMLYLPRLYVYHVDAKPGSELANTLAIMERRLLRRIVNPAMISTFVFGIWMLLLDPALLQKPYMHMKLGLVLIMGGLHVFLAKCRRRLENGQNTYSSVFFRIINEVPALLIIGIVILIIVKPIFGLSPTP